MQTDGMLSEEVEAIKKQLKLLGHSVPTDVIEKFLQNNNQLFPSYAPDSSRTSPAQLWRSNNEKVAGHGTASQRDCLPPASAIPQQANSAQPALTHTPKLDTAWAGLASSSLHADAYEQARFQTPCIVRHSA